MGDQIVLDRDVRDWVLVPLTMSIVLMMLIRQYATQVRLSAFAHGDSRDTLWTYLTYCALCHRSSWAAESHSRRWS